ncbi:MAG: DUF2516 family protein [Actinomycetota bacterium]|nr:DUF2516 family protein [Actinomycetota bacterium]
MLALVDPLLALEIESKITLGLWMILLVVKGFALGDAVIRKDEFFVAAEKQNKVFWLLLLGIFLLLHVIFRDSVLFNMIGTVAAIVYLVDVRPTLQSMQQR